MTEGTSIRVDVHAPTGPAAFALEKRLGHLSAVAIEDRHGWRVELVDVGDRLEEVEAAVRHWLGEVGSASTTALIDGKPRTIAIGPPAPVEEASLGAGYDERVLTHEP
jgi:hypothetical protein